MSSKAKGQADTRTRVLEAAATRLSRAPLGEFTVSGVARTAGVSRQTVYEHFGDRDELLADVFIGFAERFMAKRREKVLAGKLDGDALERIFWADIDASRQFFADPDDEPASVRSGIADFILRSRRMREYERSIWLPALERFAEAGVLRPGLDLDSLARWLSYQQTWLVANPSALADEEAEVRSVVRAFAIDPLLA